MARIAMFLARPPGPPMTGRKVVLSSAIAALAEEDHEVDLFVLARPEARGKRPQPPSQERRRARRARRAVWLGTPSKPAIVRNACVALLGGKYSLNEALFRSERLLAEARRLGPAYDFAIADTVRAAPYASALGIPWHLDLDDLYSLRYEKYLQHEEEVSADLVLGYYRNSVPRVASVLPRPLLKRLLRTEASRLRRRELYWASRATTVSLVSPAEARTLARLASRGVHSLPMSVSIPPERWSALERNGANAAFLGGLDYKPNLDALLYYQTEIFPLAKAVSSEAARLTHFGKAPPDLRSKFLPEVVSFAGYVSDVVSRLKEAAFFVAPIVSGTGISTKVLEAMAIGLPVIATRHAVAGLQVEHRKHCIICERPADFAEGMRYLRDPHVAERIGLAARSYVQANFSIEVLRKRWREVLRDLAGVARKASSAR